MSDLLSENGNKVFGFQKVRPENLYLFPAGVGKAKQNGYFESQRFDRFLQSAKEMFDYVIIDSAPVTTFADSQAICSKVDGVIIVIRYGVTRRQVATRVKKELEEAGAKLLGVVINRRKYYIPDWIYKRL